LTTDNKIQELGQQIFDAVKTVRPKPCVGGLLDNGIADAYAIQKVFAELVGRSETAGYKAGATSQVAQKSLGLSEPALGILPASGSNDDGATISLSQYVMPILEVEFGYVLNSPVTKPVTLESVASIIANVHLMIEIADPAFEHRPFTAADLIAGNVAGGGYVRGQIVSWQNFDDVVIRLLHDGEELAQGKGGDALGSQQQALCWLINTCLSLGYDLLPGDLLMTGSLGAPRPARQGKYTAQFEGLGELSVNFQE